MILQNNLCKDLPKCYINANNYINSDNKTLTEKIINNSKI